MRIPVVSSTGQPLMPCLAARARTLLDTGKACGRRNKLGIFYLQLKADKVPDNQFIAVGVDPGSKWEGYSVVGQQDTVVNLMCDARSGVKEKVEARANVRGARRHRKWRRPSRFNNRQSGRLWIPPSTRSRWELKYQVVKHLHQIIPIKQIVIENVCAESRKNCKKWNKSFSPVQQGKNHLYRLLENDGLTVIRREGYETAELRDLFGLKKTKDKAAKAFSSHAVDAWVMAANQTGAIEPTDKRIYHIALGQPIRRQLFNFQTQKGGYRKPLGGTRCHGLKRSTLVIHPKHGICALGTAKPKGRRGAEKTLGWNVKPLRGAWTTSYSVSLTDCKILTYSRFRGVFIRK